MRSGWQLRFRIGRRRGDRNDRRRLQEASMGRGNGVGYGVCELWRSGRENEIYIILIKNYLI